MTDELKDQRIPIMMSPSEVAAVDDWMFARRMKSRAAAIRELIKYGTEYEYWRDEACAARALIGSIMKGEDPTVQFKAWVDAANRLGELYTKKMERHAIYTEGMIEILKARLQSEDISEEERSTILDSIDKYAESIKGWESNKDQK